jgi:hypothetical protein
MDAQHNKADCPSAIRFRSNGEDNRLGHFYYLAHFLLTIAFIPWILGAEQAGRDPESFHFFTDSHQFLFFGSKYVVRVFHRGGPLTGIQDLFCLSELL